MKSVKLKFGFLLLVALNAFSAFALPEPDQVILNTAYEFGKKTDKNEMPRFDVRFTAMPNPTEVTLRLDHRAITHPWLILVNGQPAGQLGRSYKEAGKTFVPVPAGALKDGQNTLSLVGDDFAVRDGTIEKASLFKKPMRELLRLRPVTITVTDDESGKPVPARISMVNERGEGPDIFYVSNTNSAPRSGLIYTPGTPTTFEIPEGRYTFYATRGMEWSLGRQKISLDGRAPAKVALRISRQVDTTGFIAADTHIHNVTFSGHGDATIYERMLTLAGEGVELAVATDHNHVTDYEPYQTRLALNSWFTPVSGNEVTTPNGHFNAFPMKPGGALPDHRETNWVKLVSDIRLKGARVVIWNHPIYPSPQDNPYVKYGFNRATGDRAAGPPFTFNAMEIANSSSTRSAGRADYGENPVRLFAEWFPILNRGEKITGVGSSDSHTVDNPVGQGRTYIRSSTDDAARLNTDELVSNFLAGDTSISYGIFADASVNNSRHMGDLVRTSKGVAEVKLRVAAPDWIRPRRAIVFLNGLNVAEKKLEPARGKPFDECLTFKIKTPPHDAYVVCAVFGDGVPEPYWKTLANFTAAVSNPIYLDDDGDGKFAFPRETARKLLATTDGSLNSAWALLEKSDDAIAGQTLGLLYLERDRNFLKQLDARVRAAAPKRALYRTFLENSPLVFVDANALKSSAKKKKK